MSRLNSFLPAFGLSLMLMACTPSSAPEQSANKTPNVSQPVLTVITREDPQTQLMALILSKAASDQGTPVRILLCDQGGNLALNTPAAISLKPLAPKNISPVGLLAKLINSGVKVDVCAIYLPNKAFGEDALIDGVGVATPPDIASYFTQDGAKVLSF